jgi:hypothetical protein
MARLKRQTGSLFAGVAALSLVLTSTSSDATNVNPAARTFGVPAQRANVAARRQAALRPHAFYVVSPTTCNSDYSGSNGSDYFVGVDDSSQFNYALNLDSAVLGGQHNEACGYYSGIGAGGNNVVGSNGSLTDAFIGAGSENAITGSFTFLGSGIENEVTADHAFLGAGSYGTAEGNGSFVGAGGAEYGSVGNPAAGGGNIAAGTDSFIGAGDLNEISTAGNGSFIGGGGYEEASNIAATLVNNISSFDSFIGAGDDNTVSEYQSFIGAGSTNNISGRLAFIGTGEGNTVSAAGGFVGAGGTLTGGNHDLGRDAFIGSGDQNTINLNSSNSFIGGGKQNTIASSEPYATIGGGDGNDAGGEYASILGGLDNSATGEYATVAGGWSDTAAGASSFAAGYNADAAHNGSFVWSDYTSGSATIKDTAANQFVVRASGGLYLYSNEAATSGEELTPGSGTWASLSDRNAKTDIVPLDDASILAKVAALPIDRWSYKSEKGVRHVGPMAQDFYAAFGTGIDDRHITAIDEDGVALASIKALHRQVGQLRSNYAALAAKNAILERRLDQLAARMPR